MRIVYIYIYIYPPYITYLALSVHGFQDISLVTIFKKSCFVSEAEERILEGTKTVNVK
jgi:hypothetical protein